MRLVRNIILVLVAAMLSGACSFLHDDQVVAKAEGRKLYKSQVVKYIPHGIPAEDSIALARQYIHAWAAELIMNAMADKQLTSREKDIKQEIEDYRSSLLKFRYEQHYIADRLDTVVTDDQIRAYYDCNASLFPLAVPLVKARYLRIPASSPMKDDLVKLLVSAEYEDLVALDSLSYTVADKYVNYGDNWIDIVNLSREFGMDYGTLIGAMEKQMIDITDEQGMNHIAYIMDYIPGGKTPPLEYCKDKIRDLIIGQRKYALSSTLERDLLDDAVKKGNFVIYDTD